MPADLTPAAAAQPDGHADEPLVPVYRVQWSFDDLTPDQLAALPKELDGDSVDEGGEISYFAKKTTTADELWGFIARRLDAVAGSDIIVVLEDIPLSEWIGDYSGSAEDVLPAAKEA